MIVEDNDLGLTEVEQAEVDADAAGDKGKDAATDKGADDKADDKAVEKDDDADAVAAKDESATALATAASAIARAADAMTAATTRKEEVAKADPPKEPDWAAEKAKLKADYDANKLDDDQYDNAREALLERKSEWRTDARVEARLAEREVKQREDAAALDNQTWDAASKAFSQDAANADIIKDPAKTGALNGLLKAVAAEGKGLNYAQMFAEAKSRLLIAFGGSAGESDKDKAARIAKETKAREKAAGTKPKDLEAAPRAGDAVDRGASEFSELDDLDIDDLENTLAKMKPEKIAQFLEDAPGGTKDNPRGGKRK